MVWVKLDDAFVDHPKVVRLSDAAFRAHVRGLSYCARLLTDGLIPADVAPKKPVLRELTDESPPGPLWERDGQNYRIHDYLKFQPSREDVMRERAAAQERKERWKERRAEQRAERRGNGVPNGVKNGEGTGPPPPYPPPPPGSLRSPRGRGGDGACAPEERRAAPGERHSKAITDAARIGIHEDRARESIASHGIEAVERANAAALACPVRTDAVDAWFDALMETAP